MKFRIPSSATQAPNLVFRQALRSHAGAGVTLRSQRSGGMALVITLILLAVITFMAITFLVVATGEKSNVNAAKEQRVAGEATGTAIEEAGAAIMAEMLATSNLTIGFRVSTNYETPGFVTGNTSFTNVSYHYPNGNPLNQADLFQNLNNLLYLPPAPVWVTNPVTGLNELRSYLDINRNGRYDTNGYQPVINSNGSFLTLSGLPTTVYDPSNIVMTKMVGDPQWVGILERGRFLPDLLNWSNPSFRSSHSPSNHFTSRFAYMIVPTSTTLDINNIHNYARQATPSMTGNDGFLRNQGVAPWELNLAAFLTDLNTNMWPYPNGNGYGSAYLYDPLGNVGNTGAGFEDAYALLRYRYNRTWNSSLYSVASLFGPNGVSAFTSDWVDGYSSGAIMTGFWLPLDRDTTAARTTRGWPGSDNTNHFYDPQDLFDASKTRVGLNPGALGITDRLMIAGTNNDSYNRYTFFRLLSQLGAESAPEAPKLNLNYANVDVKNNIVPDLATNFQPWVPEQFFTNAIVHLLTNTFTDTDPNSPFYITNYVVNNRVQIQVFPTNHYTPSVHRLMQLAANLYDAANTNRTFGASFPTNLAASGFPAVFRPFFNEPAKAGGKVFLVDYKEVSDPRAVLEAPFGTTRLIDLNDINDIPKRPLRPTDMVAGVPVVVGARKGFPNFNEFGLLSDIKVTRTLTFRRSAVDGPIIETNQIYTLGVSNAFGLEAWNSYSNAFPHRLAMVVFADVLCSVTNPISGRYINGRLGTPLNSTFSTVAGSNLINWPGFRGSPSASSFVLPLSTNYLFLTNSDYSFSKDQFVANGVPLNDSANRFPNPHWQLKLGARVRFALIDQSSSSNRLVDYVNLSSYQAPIDVAAEIGSGASCDGNWHGSVSDLFCTNRLGNPQNAPVAADDPTRWTYGLRHQYNISLGSTGVSDDFWRQFNAQANDKTFSIQEFHDRIFGVDKKQVTFSAPFTPTRVVHQNVSMQANDPLVHYTVEDLTDYMGSKKRLTYDDDTSSDPFEDLGGRKPLNAHYRPWGGNPNVSADTTPATKANLNVKDPFVLKSDDWQFTTNKLPGLGWIGRVHRGTPWQTVFLKSPDTNAAASQTWLKWSGHINTNWDGRGMVVNDYVISDPTNDFRVVDLFTTAFNDNASRGQLSVNQTNIGAWSAVLAGLVVNTNTATNSFSFIQPAGAFNVFDTNSYPPLARIVAGINRTRADAKITTNGRFRRMGDILRTPELTAASPYINPGGPLLSDAVYERIPQQILSLLRNDEPRYVVFAFGQALKPAEHSQIISGANMGLITNYQVTAETAVRAVIHIEDAPNNPHVVIDSYNVLGPY